MLHDFECLALQELRSGASLDRDPAKVVVRQRQGGRVDEGRSMPCVPQARASSPRGSQRDASGRPGCKGEGSGLTSRQAPYTRMQHIPCLWDARRDALDHNHGMHLLRLLSLVALISLFACGGSSGPPIAEANAKEAEAIALASPTPCASDDQCGMLVFLPPVGGCGCPSKYVAYSLMAPSASAARAAAAAQRELASLAQRYETPVGICGCAAPHPPVCTATQGCQLAALR